MQKFAGGRSQRAEGNARLQYIGETRLDAFGVVFRRAGSDRFKSPFAQPVFKLHGFAVRLTVRAESLDGEHYVKAGSEEVHSFIAGGECVAEEVESAIEIFFVHSRVGGFKQRLLAMHRG